MAAAIEVHDVWKSFRVYHQRTRTLKELLLVRRSEYEVFWALKGVSFEVPRGEMLGIVGPNGSGKSTTLKTLARILVPNQGRIVTNGKISAMLELGTGFHPELSGRDNLYLAGSILGLSTSTVAERFDDIVDFSGIGEFIESPVKNYSSGMYARLAFALAVNVDADILLIDEVLSVGDEAFQQKCHERIDNMRKAGATIVYVTHNLSVVRDLCTMAVWIQDGTVHRAGDAADVVDAYFDMVHEHDVHSTWREATGLGREGGGALRITGVRTVGPDGADHSVFHPGNPCTVHFAYEATRDVDDVACTVDVRRSADGALVSSVSSTQSGPPLSVPRGGGAFTLDVAALPLVEDAYRLSIRVHDPGMRTIHDAVEGAVDLTVAGDATRDRGQLYLPGRWSVLPGPGS